jgi:hypothetical protein
VFHIPSDAMRYEASQREKAKREGLHLVTLDIDGRYAKRDGVTFQGFLFTKEQVDAAWAFFQKLVKNGRDGSPD